MSQDQPRPPRCWFGAGQPGDVDPANAARPVTVQREAPVVGTYQQRMNRDYG
jgi:hypothetical protein